MLRSYRRPAKWKIDPFTRFKSLREWAKCHRSLLPHLKTKHRITKDIRSKLIQTGAHWGLSEKQINLLKKLTLDVAKQATDVRAPVFFPGEREVVGEIVSVKLKPVPNFGSRYGVLLKVITEDPDLPADAFYLLYGAPPECLLNELEPLGSDSAAFSAFRGEHLCFNATVKCSHDDESFGFWKNPSEGYFM